MENIVIIVHVLVALAIIGLVLLQQGKGAEAGASFGGGASQTVFGSQGGGDFFSKLTAVLALVFFVTSFSLAIIAKNQSAVAADENYIGVPAIEAVQESEVPMVESQSGAADSELPSVAPNASEAESDLPAVN
jgi:preprotein translocase subunit SecG